MTATVSRLAGWFPAVSRDRPEGFGARDEVPTGPLPWELRDLKRLLACGVLGIVGIAGSWFGVSGTTSFARGQGWLVLGVGGLVVWGIGIASWLLTAFRVVRIRQARAVTRALPDEFVETVDVTVIAGGADQALVSAPGMTLFHRPDCQLVDGKRVRPVTAIARSSLQACQICLPAEDLRAPQ